MTVNYLPGSGGGGGDATAANQVTGNNINTANGVLLGPVNETAPASDTASSGLNGRLQRIAQRLTSLIALLPASLGVKVSTGSLPVVIASDDAQIGTKTTAASMPAGGLGILGWLSAIFTSLFSATAYTDVNRVPTTEPDGLTVSGSVTSAAVLFTQDMTGYQSLNLQVTSGGSGNTLTVECSEDNTTWSSNPAMAVSSAGNVNTSSLVISTGFVFKAPRSGRYMRVRCSVYGSGTVSVAGSCNKTTPIIWTTNQIVTGAGSEGGTYTTYGGMRQMVRGVNVNPGALSNDQLRTPMATLIGVPIVRPHCIPESSFQFASTAITNSTTAQTIQAAQAAGIRNYLTGIQVTADALATAQNVVVRDGASGTAIWRGRLPTSGGAINVTFDSPLRGGAATLMEVAMEGASATGSVVISAQGYFAP